MTETLYGSLTTPRPLRAAEPKGRPYLCLSERHLQALWLEQKYFHSLKTAGGQPLEVLSPGMWNAEAGPDFLKAHIKIGVREYRGDIEIHLNDNEWQQHHHDTDSRYNQVVLHVSMWRPEAPKPIVTQNGRVVMQMYLTESLVEPEHRILQLIDLDLYPYRHFVGSGRCAHDLFQHASQDGLQLFFNQAADWRLIQKRSFLASYCIDTHSQMLLGMTMALGYKKNTKAFLSLFLYLQKLPSRTESEWLALMLSICGYFSSTYQEKWASSSAYMDLLNLAKTLPPHPQLELETQHTRPLNQPLRRLVILAKMLSDHQLTQLWTRVLAQWTEVWPTIRDKRSASQALQLLLSLLPHYTDAYWNHHYNFEVRVHEVFVPLMGDNIKREMFINTFLPLLRATIADASPEKEALHILYSSIPASSSSKSRYLVHRFFGDNEEKGGLLDLAIAEQGAFQIHRDFCLHFEASCVGCPFVERIKSHPATFALFNKK
ncbi:MAG: DUF2851 family protein [Parachlamydiaceae bacterium]|nr:DUF2851 family protein [Parachlamydiaceae bacterium]